MQGVATRIEMDEVARDLRAAHYAIPNAVRAALREAVEDVALPAMRSAAPSFGRPLLTARSQNTVGYITTRGSRAKDRALGLLNYGGTVRGRIEPKAAQRQRTFGELQAAIPSVRSYRAKGAKALKLPWGPRAAVTKPRTYRGKFFLQGARTATLGAVAEVFEDKALAIYRERGWTTEKGGRIGG